MQSLKTVGWVNRLSEAWVTGPSLELCESPEFSVEVGSGGPLGPEKGEGKLVGQTLSRQPAQSLSPWREAPSKSQ